MNSSQCAPYAQRQCCLWPPYGIGRTIIFSSLRLFCLSFSSFFLAESQPSQIGCLPYFHAWGGLSTNLGCRSETCGTWLAEKRGCKNRHLGSIAQLCRAISSQLRYRQSEKKLLSSNISSTCPDNMVNFGPLVAEIGLPVWGTPANFNGFHLLAALLHGSLVVDITQTLRH